MTQTIEQKNWVGMAAVRVTLGLGLMLGGYKAVDGVLSQQKAANRLVVEKEVAGFGASVVWERAAVETKMGPETEEVVVMHTGWDEGPGRLADSIDSKLNRVMAEADTNRAFVQVFTNGLADSAAQWEHIKATIMNLPEQAKITMVAYSVGVQYLSEMMKDEAFMEQYGDRIKELILICPLTGPEGAASPLDQVTARTNDIGLSNLASSGETIEAIGALARRVKKNGGEVRAYLASQDGMVNTPKTAEDLKGVGIEPVIQDRGHGLPEDELVKMLGR